MGGVITRFTACTRSVFAKTALASAFVLVAAFVSYPMSASAQQKLVIAHTGTPGNAVYVFWDEFAKRVTQYSQGKLKPEVHSSGELGGDDQLLQSIRLGTLDMISAGNSNMASLTKALLWTDFPYVFNTAESMQKVYGDPIISEKLRTQIEKDVGTRVLGYVGNGGFRLLENKKRPLKTPADVKGVKFRTTAAPTDVALITAWGGLPSQVAWSETFSAVQQGVVDGLNLQPVWTELNGFGKILPFATRNRAIIGVHVAQISLKTWNGLSPDLQGVIQKAATEAAKIANDTDVAQEEDFIEKMKAGGMQVYTPTAAEMDLWRRAAAPVTEKFKGQVDQAILARAQAIQK